MPSGRATAHTCCPPAPPKPTSAHSRGSTPRATDTCAIACAMLALATSTKPAATSSRVRSRPAARSARADRVERGVDRLAREREREAVRLHAAEREVRVGERELARAGAPVAERARLRARALGADREAEAVEAAQRAAARRDGVDAQHRRAHAHAADHRLEAARQLAAPRAATRRSRCRPCRSRPRARSPRARRRAVAPTTPPAGPESSAFGPRKRSASVSPPDDCMKRSSRVGQRRAQRRGVSAQERREVGVDHGRLGAREQPGFVRDLVRRGDVLEARPRARAPRARAPSRVGGGVDQRDRHRRGVPRARRAASAARAAAEIERLDSARRRRRRARAPRAPRSAAAQACGSRARTARDAPGSRSRADRRSPRW